MKPLIVIAVCIAVLSACNSVTLETPTLVPELNTLTATVLPPTAKPSQTHIPPSPTITDLPPTITATSLPPTKTPVPACVTLIYGEFAQFEMISSSGQRILVDIYDPEILSSPVTENDVLLTTHTHWDHLNEGFQAGFPGLQLFVQTGMLEASGAIIQGIASAHNRGDALKPEGGTNYIYLIEMGGLRIAHFGDIGQDTFTEEQLVVLGQVDIAISQLNNPYSDMNAENQKGVNLMDQLQPRLIIPTHLNLDTAKLAVAQWSGYTTETPTVEICESDLSWEETQILFIGDAAETMQRYLVLDKWENK